MGLSITAYNKAKLIEHPQKNNNGDNIPTGEKEVLINIGNSGWEQANTLEKSQVYSFEESLGELNLACSEYTSFRNQLARIAGYSAAKSSNKPHSITSLYSLQAWQEWDRGERGGVLAELINFTDSEGEIGNQTCRKILADLQTVSKRSHELDKDNQERLFKLIETFKFAEADGFVQFH